MCMMCWEIFYFIIQEKINWLWFDIIIIFKDETLNLQGIKTLSKIHIYSKIMKKKKCHVFGQL